MINSFLDWAQEQQGVWIVINKRLLDWVKNPVPLSQLNDFESFKCPVPQVDAKICNGVPENEAGLVQRCAFNGFPFSTSYGCPGQIPSLDNPSPPQATPTDGSSGLRYRLPSNCLTAFWDPIGGKCLCTSSQWAFTDQSRTIGDNGADLTGGGTGNTQASSTVSPYTPFNGGTSLLQAMGPAFVTSMVMTAVGVMVGAGVLAV